MTRLLATDTSVWSHDVWIVDSTPVECGRSARPSNTPTWLGGPSTGTAPATADSSGACACTWCPLQGVPIAFALTGAKADERETLLDLLAAKSGLTAARPEQTLIGDKNYFGLGFEHQLADHDIRLPRPARPNRQ
ncbi:transposase [Streptomyces chiangmaiensis]